MLSLSRRSRRRRGNIIEIHSHVHAYKWAITTGTVLVNQAICVVDQTSCMKALYFLAFVKKCLEKIIHAVRNQINYSLPNNTWD